MKISWFVPLLLLMGWMALPGDAHAIELCEAQSKTLMRSVGITEQQIKALCAKAARSRALLALALVRAEDELGYCRVTLALNNNSTENLDSMVISSIKNRFDLFRFNNVFPGGTGYASANSRIPISCQELHEVKLTFHWPASLRIGNRAPSGFKLRHYKPVLLDAKLAWSQ